MLGGLTRDGRKPIAWRTLPRVISDPSLVETCNKMENLQIFSVTVLNLQIFFLWALDVDEGLFCCMVFQVHYPSGVKRTNTLKNK